MQETDQSRLTEVEVRKILSELIQSIEDTPNNMELGDLMRKRYWKELKEMKVRV